MQQQTLYRYLTAALLPFAMLLAGCSDQAPTEQGRAPAETTPAMSAEEVVTAKLRAGTYAADRGAGQGG